MNGLFKMLAISFLVTVLAWGDSSPSVAQTPLESQGSSKLGLTWLYESPLTVYERITDLGNGLFEYYYSFENVDAKNLWHFGVYTSFDIVESTTSWDNFPTWALNENFNGGGLPYYPGEIDPSLINMASTWGPNLLDTDNPIAPGVSVQGFTFVGPINDGSPKLYFYETVEDGWANDIVPGPVAAIGYTQSTPVAVESRSWSEVKALYR